MASVGPDGYSVKPSAHLSGFDPFRSLANLTVAPDSHQLSVALIPTTTRPDLIMVYRNLAHVLNIMHGVFDKEEGWIWHNVTRAATAIFRTSCGETPGSRLLGTCAASSFRANTGLLFCFADMMAVEPEMMSLTYGLTSRRNLYFEYCRSSQW